MTSKYQKNHARPRPNNIKKKKGGRKNFFQVLSSFLDSLVLLPLLPGVCGAMHFYFPSLLFQCERWTRPTEMTQNLFSFYCTTTELQNFFRQIKPNHKSFRLLNSIAKSSTTEGKSFAVQSKFQLAWGEFKIMPAKCKK